MDGTTHVPLGAGRQPAGAAALPAGAAAPPAEAGRAGGAALPLALAGLAILYLLAAGGYTVASLEYRISRSHLASVEAFYAADGALWEYLGTESLPPGVRDFQYPGGDASVTAEPLFELAAGDRLYRILSVGVAGNPVDGTASRTVGLTALAPAPLRLPAALVALTGLEVEEGVLISGEDAAVPGPDCEPGDPVAGALVPEGSGPAPDVGDLRGEPPLLETDDPTGELGSGRPDWREWLADPPTGSAEGGPSPLILEGDPAMADGALSGQGILLAPGDLELSAGFEWRGLVLAGGALRAEGEVAVEGGAVAGLELLLADEGPDGEDVDGEGPDGEVEASRLGPGVEIRWHSCHAAAAAAALPLGLVAIPGTWSEAF